MLLFIVVNCFQNVSLTCRFQFQEKQLDIKLSCELLSKCIFDMSLSIHSFEFLIYNLLWIAFKMYLWHVAFNQQPNGSVFYSVVNCFQNVSLTCRFQYLKAVDKGIECCELLSKCIFDMSLSISINFLTNKIKLWIAFKMYLWHVAFNAAINYCTAKNVVNCFQNVSLTCRFQSAVKSLHTSSRCELLSKCIFDMSLSI